MTFAQALQTNPAQARTENGMKALEQSGNQVVDLFFNIGASRGKSIAAQFERAYQEDRDLAIKVALWARDIRGGSGERELFREILQHLETYHPEDVKKLLPFVSEFGRWDDLLVFKTEEVKALAYTLIGDALKSGNGLAAKWCPRKGDIAVELRTFLGMTPKQYRKTLVNLTSVVETKMCAQQWDQIEFGKLPSLAAARYNRAFLKNAKDNYLAYKQRLVAGTDKINAAAVYPYDVIKTLRAGGDKTVADAQWAALPNYIGDASILPLVDVSGSMCCPAGGNSITCLDVALSLGLYCADKNSGAFKDVFLTFSARPEAVILKGTLSEKMSQMNGSDWDMNTNLHAAFDEILRIAVAGQVPAKDMPRSLLILSDMQFDQCVSFDDSAYEMICRKYQAAGYSVPNIVFWNLRSTDSVPVKFDQSGTALISGFSPAVMKAVLSGDAMTPEGIVRATVDIPRYSVL